MKTYLSSINGKMRHDNIPWNADMMISDLGLKPIFNAMSGGDDFLLKNSINFVLNGSISIDEIMYRQEILKDLINNEETARKIYKNALEFTTKAKKQLFWFSDKDSFSIPASTDILRKFVLYTGELRNIILRPSIRFLSRGLEKFCRIISEDFGSEYMENIQKYLDKANFRDSVTLSMALGPGNSGIDYILHEPFNGKSVKKIMKDTLEKHYTYVLNERDINGAAEIEAIKSRGLRKVAITLTIAARNAIEFYSDIKSEVGFYLGAINLIKKIKTGSGHICFPIPRENKEVTFTGLYDLGLLLSTDVNIVSNCMESKGTELFIITGTNRGGKSTFLRSMGQAQLLMQAGIFVPAETFTANTVSGIYTHFKHEEDRELNRGKFEDELSKMNEIVSHIKKNGMILLNESFSSTNTREGSEIAMEVTRALLENGMRVFFVSHLYEFASTVVEEVHNKSLFLVAERTEDGEHTYRIMPGKPSETGHGMDVYRKIFEVDTNVNLGKLNG